jgi:hypothetical protein
MPFEALSANARLIVPVGAIDSRWLLRMPCLRICALMSSGSRAAKLVPDQVQVGVEQRERAALPRSALDARYALSRIDSAIAQPSCAPARCRSAGRA